MKRKSVGNVDNKAQVSIFNQLVIQTVKQIKCKCRAYLKRVNKIQKRLKHLRRNLTAKISPPTKD